MRLFTSKKSAHRIAVGLHAICFLAVLFFALAAVLALMGRVGMSMQTPEGRFEYALLLEKDHAVTSRGLHIGTFSNSTHLITTGSVGFITWFGVSLMAILQMFPAGFCFCMLKRFFGNIAEDRVFVSQNAEALKKGGLSLILFTFITPLTNGFLIPALVNNLSSNKLTVLVAIDPNQLFFGFVLLVMAYVFSYGLYLQGEVDCTL